MKEDERSPVAVDVGLEELVSVNLQVKPGDLLIKTDFQMKEISLTRENGNFTE